MKNILYIIIGLLITLLISFGLWYGVSSAKVLETCKLESFDLAKITENKDGTYAYKFIGNDEPFGDQEFRIFFAKASTKYHNYVKCVFDEAAKSMTGDEELNDPEKVCPVESQLVKILQDGSPENLLKPLLSVHDLYLAHLEKLYQKVSLATTVDFSTTGNFAEVARRNNYFKQLVENEAQNSLVALDSALIALKEMRQAFVMHMHFMCMLKNLEFYRRVMSNLRSVVTVIPPLIKNASIHK